MTEKIRVAILDDHQSIIDGYLYRLSLTPEIEVVATGHYGEELDTMFAENPVDVLLLDVNVPTSPDNANPYPILHIIPQLLQTHPKLNVLVISMHNQRTLIKAVLETGASGYIFKDDQMIIKDLGAAVRSVAQGGICISRPINEMLLKGFEQDLGLTPRQSEILSLLTAYPDLTTAEAAVKLNITHSTARSLLSDAYLRLGVRNRSAAIAKARRLGLVTPTLPFVESD
ncbi:MAG: response regulator transcription factor [Candidatus Promineifilaceae bacterium]